VCVSFASMADSAQLDVTPGAANPGYGTTPALPSPYDGFVDMLLPSATPGVVTSTTGGLYAATNLNNGAVSSGGADGTNEYVFLDRPQRAAFSGLAANLQYLRIWGDSGDRLATGITVKSTTSVLTGADLLDPTKYETTALATTAFAYDLKPFPRVWNGYDYSDAQGKGFAIVTAANTRGLLVEVTTTKGGGTYGARIYEIQAFAGTAPVNQAPTVSITSPANNADIYPGTDIVIAATAADDSAVTKVELYADGTLIHTATTAPYSYTWSGAAPRAHALTAVAYDDTTPTAQSTTSATVNLNVIDRPPTVSITSPTNNATIVPYAPIVINAAAADDSSVASVEFFADDVSLHLATTAPYTYTWTSAAPGTHTLKAVATDNTDQTTTSTLVHIAYTNPLLDLTPEAANPGYGATPALPTEYGGFVNVLLPSVTPGVTTTTTAVWAPDNSPVNTLPTANVYNNGTLYYGTSENGPPNAEIFTALPQRVAFSGLAAAPQYLRVWGDSGDRVANGITVMSTTSVLTGADLLDPAKYETTALATSAFTYDINPWPYISNGYDEITPKGKGFAIATAANTRGILVGITNAKQGGTYGARMYEIQAFANASAPPATPYQTWMNINAPGGTATGDGDGDGVGNAVEFVLGGTKDTNDLGKLPRVSTDGTKFSFDLPQTSTVTGTVLRVQFSTDLSNWDVIPSVEIGATASGPIVVEIPQNGAKTFARLQVTIP